MWYVYVLRCCDASLYIGMTNDVQRRLREHNRSLVAWTKSRLPVSLMYQDAFSARSEARKREKYLKSGWGKQWLKRKFGDPSGGAG
ncbi:MAG: GIY-YIG nuclease family protein [Planctomycetota bacterium]|nr:GIY-YIG nuclease family protein [Planctomycetota bacterium]